MNLIGEIKEISQTEQRKGVPIRTLLLEVRNGFIATDSQAKARHEYFCIKLLFELAQNFSLKVGDNVFCQVVPETRKFFNKNGVEQMQTELRMERCQYLSTNPQPMPYGQQSVQGAQQNSVKVQAPTLGSQQPAPDEPTAPIGISMPEAIDINGEAGYTRHLL